VRFAVVVALLAVVACEPLAPPALQLVPLPPPPPTTYIENNYNIVMPALAPQPAPPTPPTPPPPSPPSPSLSPRPPYCACIATATLPPDRSQLASTSIASCDEYLARTEISVRCSTSQPGPLSRVLSSLDLSRRAWSAAAATPTGHASLVDSCAVALASIASSNADACGR